jgi:riboflavin synthase
VFTGLIQEIGKVVKCDGKRVWIRARFSRVIRGESISIDGVCLTVAAKRGRDLAFDIGPETARITTLGTLRPRAAVNLERALRYGDRLGGHWVTGHVEQTGTIEGVRPEGRSRWVAIRTPAAVRRYVVAKGSLAVDGISLTVAKVKGSSVEIMLIPHTIKKTTLSRKVPGARVNLEPDLLAKYAAQQRGAGRSA